MTRVLVIDDEPDVLLLCRVNLQHAGYDVLEASDGPRGLELARTEAPDAIVLDLMMPSMDGYEVLGQLAADPRTRAIPVLVLTAKAQREDRIRCWQAGASEFITKPFSPVALGEAVERISRMSPEERRERREAALEKLLGV